MVTNNLKRNVFRILTVQPLNFVISRILKLFSIQLPFFFPVIGRLKIILKESPTFYMESDGRDSIASRLYLYGPQYFESESLELFAHILEFDSVDVVLDVGANTGVYTLLASAYDSSSVVHSFEPMLDIHARLLENVRTNSFENVCVHKLALSDESGDIDFHFVPAVTVPTGGSAAKEGWPGVERVIVNALTLDDFSRDFGLKSVDLIKIDTEMTEPSILRGGRNVLVKYKPFIICEVLDDKSATEISLLLGELGYRFFHILDCQLKEMLAIEHDPSYQFANYLFVHTDRMSEMKSIIFDKPMQH